MNIYIYFATNQFKLVAIIADEQLCSPTVPCETCLSYNEIYSITTGVKNGSQLLSVIITRNTYEMSRCFWYR